MIPTPLGTRSLSTAILYLLTADDPSRFHRLRFDEVWFFHAGSPVEMVFLDPLGDGHIIGPEAPQALAPGGRWIAPPEVAEPTGEGAPERAASSRAAARLGPRRLRGLTGIRVR